MTKTKITKKSLFKYENHFAVEKNSKKFSRATSKILCCRHQKNASHTLWTLYIVYMCICTDMEIV